MVSTIGIQANIFGMIAQQQSGQNGHNHQQNGNADVERTIVAAQIVGNVIGHDRGADNGEQGGTQGNDAQNTAAIADEPVGSQLEAGHLQAHTGAANHKQGNPE